MTTQPYTSTDVLIGPEIYEYLEALFKTIEMKHRIVHKAGCSPAIDMDGLALFCNYPTPPFPEQSEEQDWKINNTFKVAIGPQEFMSMASCPIGVKVQLLNRGFVAVYGTWDGKSLDDWKGWCHLPTVPKSLRGN